jgi:cellulose synthase/poly-beta-1,6-N-acetylglucosamine synthase-like glycosyltransferase
MSRVRQAEAFGSLARRKWLSGRVLLAVSALFAGPAAGLLAIGYPQFLYLLYVALSFLVGVVATSTLVWMLYAWRTPDTLDAGRLKADGRAAACSFSLIVPARHEEAVLETTLSRLIASDHPDYEVLVVVGHDDHGTREVAERMAARHPELIRVIVDSNWPKSKPKALNAALPYCSAAVTGVFDAEDDVHPALLSRVDQCFQTTDADIVQAGVQLMNFRSRWFTVHNVLEYYFWFRSRLHIHARQRFIPLGGNTVFIRTSILRAVGGWWDCLTEDCEIGVRLSALGAKTAVFYEPELVTREECPPTVRDFVRQRTRWNQGFLQTLGRGYWLRLPIRQRALGGYILASPYVMALTWVMIPAAIATAVAIKAPVLITMLSFLPLVPMLAMLVSEGVGLAEFCRTYGERPGVRDYARLVIGLLPYQILLAYAATRAVVRQARGTTGWDKTTHLGQHLGQPAVARVETLAAVRPPVESHALAQDLVGSPVLTEASAPAGRPLDSPRAYQPAGATASSAPPGNGIAELPADYLDRLFGDPGDEPLWNRLDDAAALQVAALEPPPAPSARRPGGGAGRRRRFPGPFRNAAAARDFLRGAATRRPDLLIHIALLTAAAVVVGTNLTHWPATQFDEGTYVGNAWALQHGRLANYTYSYGHPPLGWLLIFFWTDAIGVVSHGVFSIDHARELMLALCLVSCSLLYSLGRRLGFGRPAAAAAVLLFALCPLGVFFHRAVLLDNPSMAFAIAAFLLARSPERRLWAFVGSGACFALSVLAKETTFVLLPAWAYAVIQNTDRRTRYYCLMLAAAFFGLVGGIYPLYATLKHELLPGPGHVSLVGYLAVQLITRQGTGSIFSPLSQGHAIVLQWMQLDPWLLFAAGALVPLALIRRGTRPEALAFLIQVAILFKPGYLPNMYVIGMLPFAALIVPGGLDSLWRWARLIKWPRAVWVVRAAIAATACAAAVFIAPRWAAGDRVAMTVRLDGPERAAEQWLTGHVSHGKRIIVTDQYWVYLVEHGFHDQPMEGGFFSDTVVSYWPLDYDPAVRKAFSRGWRDFNYIVVNQNMLDTMTKTPSSAEAVAHSRIVASFGQGPASIQIRQIETSGG